MTPTRWLIFVIGVIAIAFVFLWPRPITGADADLVAYRRTLAAMSKGVDYYTAMEEALEGIDSAPSQIRSIRLPTAFYLWRTGIYEAPVVFALISFTGAIVARSSGPAIGLALVGWLSSVAFPFGYEQWGAVEFWCLPFVTSAILAIERDRWSGACALAFVAALLRELCAPLLLGGAFAAWRAKRPVWPWLVATAAWIGAFTWHAIQASSHLSAAGGEKELFLSGGLRSMVEMAGPYSYGIGLVVVTVAVIVARGRPEWWFAIGLVAGIPLIGLLIDRPAWGILALPTAAALLPPWDRVKEEIASLIASVRPSRT